MPLGGKPGVDQALDPRMLGIGGRTYDRMNARGVDWGNQNVVNRFNNRVQGRYDAGVGLPGGPSNPNRGQRTHPRDRPTPPPQNTYMHNPSVPAAVQPSKAKYSGQKADLDPWDEITRILGAGGHDALGGKAY